MFYYNAILFCTLACPGSVYISSITSTCHSITIYWELPRDENNIPYEVKFKYWLSPEQRRKVNYYTIASSASYTIVDLPSDVLVSFSVKAMNKHKKKGHATYYAFKTKKSSEPMLCYAARVH